jgi:hypothetical protein
MVLISVRGGVNPRTIEGLEGLGKLKKSEDFIDPSTFRLVEEPQLSYRTPVTNLIYIDTRVFYVNYISVI